MDKSWCLITYNEIAHLHKMIEEKDNQMAQLDRLAYSQRYRLSSGAELDHIFVPNYRYPSLHIWTKVGEVLFDDTIISACPWYIGISEMICSKACLSSG